MIIFDRVGVRYPRAPRDAVSHVSFAAPRGAITAVVGPNGSGKSTLLRALIGRVATREGSIRIDERDVRAMGSAELSRHVAAVPQREELAFPIHVAEYVALGRFPHVGTWRSHSAVDRAAIDSAMGIADVADFAGRRVDTLSGGEWQRTRLARALAQGGDGLILDEPTTFLDIGHEMAVFELLATLAGKGKAVLLVSHQLNLVARFAEQMVLLAGGAVVQAGSPDDVMRGSVLEPVYEWPLTVTRDAESGALAAVPKRKPSS